MFWLLGASGLLLALLVGEAILTRRAADRIPCRVMVTGTRGKSGLVRVLAAGLRTVEPATWGKITGDIASLVTPEGRLQPLPRRGPPHLREQVRLVRDCRKRGARCLVVESMSVTPEAMAAEARLLRPTLVVVTNVRDDHRETLGCDADRQRAAYLAAIPRGCRWLTHDEELIAFARRAGRNPESSRPPAAGAGGDPGGHDVAAELAATAEAAMAALGWDPEPARGVMRTAAARLLPPARVVSLLGRELVLLDAFSANEPESLTRLWTQWRRDIGTGSAWSVLLNTRADRPLRTRQFCRWLSGRDDVGRIYLAGSHVPAAARLLRRFGSRVVGVPRGEPVPVFTAGDVVPGPGGRELLVGLGNVQGIGLRLRAEFAGVPS